MTPPRLTQRLTSGLTGLRVRTSSPSMVAAATRRRTGHMKSPTRKEC